MVKVTEILRKVLKKYPLYAESLAHGIVNYSALARILKKEIQHERLETVSHQAVAIALKRNADEQKKRLVIDTSIQPVQGITVRSGLVVQSFEKSPTIIKNYQKLLKHIETLDTPFLHYDQGMRDINFIVSEEILPELEVMTKKEKLIKKYTDCSLVTVTMTHESLDYPGVVERFFRVLAWEHVNLISFFHTHGELTFVVEKHDARKTYELVSALAKI